VFWVLENNRINWKETKRNCSSSWGLADEHTLRKAVGFTIHFLFYLPQPLRLESDRHQLVLTGNKCSWRYRSTRSLARVWSARLFYTRCSRSRLSLSVPALQRIERI